MGDVVDLDPLASMGDPRCPRCLETMGLDDEGWRCTVCDEGDPRRNAVEFRFNT